VNEKIPKRISAAILNSMTAGVVPRVGLEYIAVGRKQEIETLLRDLENVGEGAASFRFIVGRYGSGKSFLFQLIRNYAMDRGFVVADVDLSPEKRLSGSANQGLFTYRELTQRLSTKVRPDGGALEAILQKWISSIKAEIIKGGVPPTDIILDSLVEKKIIDAISGIDEFAHGFDFSFAISSYYRSFVQGDDEKKQSAVRWLRGEFSTKTEAKAALRVGEIINDDNWYEYFKLLAGFFTKIGYRGLILFIDECVNLYKIPNRVSRERNYEKLLSLFNDTMQGKARNLGICMAGTPQFVEDERRGLYSYAALKSRLEANSFVKSGYADYSSPVIKLKQLADEELFLLMERLTAIHATHFDYAPSIVSADILAFMELAYSKLGSEQLLTPRELTRDYLALLNILRQNPEASFDSLIHAQGYAVQGLSSDPDEAGMEDEYAGFEL
jgi:hypothetical protein